jgi:hypothetical protein
MTRKEDKAMELHKAASGRNRIPSLVRSVEEAVTDRIKKYLYWKVQKPNRSHFCLFLLLLLAARHAEMG